MPKNSFNKNENNRLSLFRVEALEWLTTYYVYALLAAAAFVFSITGSFDGYLAGGFHRRLLFWFPVLFLGYLVVILNAGLLRAFAGKSAAADRLTSLYVLAFSVILIAIFTRSYNGYLGNYTPTFGQYARAVAHGLFIVIGLRMVFNVFEQKQEENSVAEESLSDVSVNDEATAPDTVPHYDDLPLYIESEDHYLKIVRPDGVEMVRATLAEKAEHYDGAGFRCHQSFWVSFGAVESRFRDGRRLMLRLKTGDVIPVGRSYEKAVTRFPLHIDRQKSSKK